MPLRSLEPVFSKTQPPVADFFAYFRLGAKIHRASDSDNSMTLPANAVQQYWPDFSDLNEAQQLNLAERFYSWLADELGLPAPKTEPEQAVEITDEPVSTDKTQIMAEIDRDMAEAKRNGTLHAGQMFGRDGVYRISNGED